MKVAMIDPWGINNIGMYTNGICSGISETTELTLFTNYYFQKNTNSEYEIKNIFFEKSEQMKRGKIRILLRGYEYIKSYIKVIKELRKKNYDVVHIQWLLMYKIDIWYLKKIKKHCKKLVYTAHNVIPHSKGESYVKDLKKIYKIVDAIILHGHGIKEEFETLFPEFKEKVVIQNHGTYLNHETIFNIDVIDKDIISKLENYDKIFIFFGNMFYNKGVDRLAKIWIENLSEVNQLLIIAGRKNAEYKELNDIEEKIYTCGNILYINEYVENNLLNYLINKSDVILLPYRHASMSGVIFTAAEFNKPVLCTDTGALAEYIVNRENSFLVENDTQKYHEMLEYISYQVSKRKLIDMGYNLNVYISENYSWNNIGRKLYEEVYRL